NYQYNMQNSTTTGNDFIVDDCFADDDLVTSDADINTVATEFKQQLFAQQKSFLERDNFENELGPSGVNEDPFGENFTDMASNEIIDVFGEGDFAARFVQFTLDKIVDQDYTVIYFHYGLRSNNKPPFKWLFNVYQLLDRRYKKNLKALYLVHPTKFIRFVWRIFQPVISFKFEKKLHYVNSLNELTDFVSTTNLNLPQPIIDFDLSISSSSPKSSVISSFENNVEKQPPRPTQQFNVSLKFIMDHNPNCDIPPIASDLMDFLLEHGLQTKGIFRRSANVTTLKALQQRINLGEKIDFLRDPEFNGDLENSILLASVLLKTFLRSLGEPLITNKLYPELTLLAAAIEKPAYIDATRDLLQRLPPENLLLLKRIIEFLKQIEAHSEENLMNANNLSVVFGPNLTWPTDQQVPMSQLNNLNKFCYTLIKHFDSIFADN
uniref:Rho GTPase-activating protein 1-like protein n=1 Tax=Meloidogyne floridensis TaxID=298350 RepID=A0A915P093_9BILA